MKVIPAKYEILTEINGEEALKAIELAARTCYKSEDLITKDSAERIVRRLIESGHEAMLEHYSFSVKFTVDRGVSHEIVRHRVASFAQESTRYCNYSKGKFGQEITVIKPCFWDDEKSLGYALWYESCAQAESYYFSLLNHGATPQEARSVLPNSLKTDIVVTANLREWRHFFKLRAVGLTGAPHPQMVEVALPLLYEMQQLIPVVFDDIKPNCENT